MYEGNFGYYWLKRVLRSFWTEALHVIRNWLRVFPKVILGFGKY